MRTTVDLSDDLFRQAKSEAALRGRKLKDLVEEGLRLVLAKPVKKKQAKKPTLWELMRDSSGIFDSGVEDLASNPKYMKDFGRDSMGHR